MSEFWYFAYGSNLDPSRMAHRTGPINVVKPARLPGHRLEFNKLGSDDTGKANVVPDAESEVPGVVYRCSESARAALDECEGFPKHYDRAEGAVVLDSGETVAAFLYVAQPDRVAPGLRPTPEYLNHVLVGARHHGLPPSHISLIETFASPGGPPTREGGQVS